METTQPTQQQQPPATRPRLERLRDDRVIAGVASGLGRYLGVDPAWVRIGFVLTTLFGGAGILAYLIAWIAIPEEGESDSVLTTKTRRNPKVGSWVGIGLIVLAGMILIDNTGLVDGEIVFAAGLIVLGVLLYRGDIGGKSRDADMLEGSSRPTPATLAGTPETTRYDLPADTVVAPEPPDASEPPVVPEPPIAPEPPAPPAPAFQPRPPKRRESSALGRLTVATALIVVGVMGVGQSAGWWDPLARHYAGAVLVTLGGALLIGSIFGRARWLIAIGLISSPLLFAGALLDVPLDGGFGDPHYSPQAVVDLQPEYRLVGGEMVLDLSGLELGAEDVYQVDASVAFGRMGVLIPDGVGFDVTGEVDGGEIRVDGRSVDNGLNADVAKVYEGSGLIELDLHVGFGELSIQEVER